VTRVDAHVHVGESLQGFGQPAADVLAEMERLEIARSVLVPVRPAGYGYEPENEPVAGLVRDHTGRFWGLGRVDPRQPGRGPRPGAAWATWGCTGCTSTRGRTRSA
jgi:hypothetical protein